MSGRLSIHLDSLLSITDFSLVRWDTALFDFQKTYHTNYIDIICNKAVPTTETFDPFLKAAEHLNITCTFKINDLEKLNLIQSIPKFHRLSVNIFSDDKLQEILNSPIYKKNVDRIILNLEKIPEGKIFKALNELQSYIIVNTNNNESNAIKSLPAFFLNSNSNETCNSSYQKRWPYEDAKINPSLAQIFFRHVANSKYKLIRHIVSVNKRHDVRKKSALYQQIFFLLEKVLRWIFFKPRRIKFLRSIEPIKHYSLKTYPKVSNYQETMLQLLSEQSKLKKISSSEYKTTNCFYDKMNGSIEWRSIFFNLKKSTPLITSDSPCLIKAQFSGTARLIGFYIHNQQYILCEADKQTHDLALYIDDNGSYTLLKDGQVTQAVFSKSFHTPARVSTQSNIGLAAKSILGSLITQQIRYWDKSSIEKKSTDINYSVVVVCTRFSRRLEQLLKSISTQNYATEKLQILVCYVPGLDGTDDLIDSIQLAYPKITIQRLPFHASKQHHKGYMINKAAQHVIGKKVLLTDADIVMPPNLFETLDQKYASHGFIGAYARKMLSPETTAKILLGELSPKHDYADIIDNDQGELRIDEAKGRPVGFFQLIKTEYLHQIPYQDLPNFEGADAFFAEDISKSCEKPTIAKEITLLHLDHGGSQWYGAKRHM